MVGSVEPTIDGKNVVGWGLIYGVNKAGGNTFNISDDDMRVNSDSKYVAALDSTSQGTTDTVFGSSDTATYFVRTTFIWFIYFGRVFGRIQNQSLCKIVRRNLQIQHR